MHLQAFFCIQSLMYYYYAYLRLPTTLVSLVAFYPSFLYIISV